MKSKIVSKFEFIFHEIFLFFFIFQPAISKLSIAHILTMILILIVGWNAFGRHSGKILLNNNLLFCIGGFIPFFIYYIITMSIKLFFSSNDVSEILFYNIVIFLLVIFRIVLSIVYLYILIKDRNYDFDKLMTLFICVAIIQTILVILALLIPTVRSFFNGLTLKYSNSIYVKSALVRDTWRSYGFAGNIFDAFGYTTALLIIMTFIKGIDKQKNGIIILSIIMFIMPLLNARTGLYLALIGIIITLIIFKAKITPQNTIKGIITILLTFVIAVILYSKIPDATKSWISIGFDSTTKLLKTGEKVGVYSVILQDNFIFPDNLLFGAGGDPMDMANLSRGIESGYIQCIWRYGLIGTVLLFLGYINLFIMAYKNSNGNVKKCISLSFMVIFFIYLIKLFSLYNTGANIMIIGLPIIIILERDKKYNYYLPKY